MPHTVAPTDLAGASSRTSTLSGEPANCAGRQTWETTDAEDYDQAKELDPGEVIDDRYQVQQLLGSGGMGRVYSGLHLGLGRPIAIKVLSAAQSHITIAARRFDAEGRAAAAVSHPGIVDVLDTGLLEDGRPYLIMERIEGWTLAEELSRRAPIPWTEACSMVAELASAVDAAHRSGLIHRDLKPANIMVSTTNDRRSFKILDFGIAANLSIVSDTQMTRPGQLLGTPLYMAPEQADAAAPTPQMDIYALGCILFQALTGSPPFDEADPFVLIARKRQEAAPTLDRHPTRLPAELIHVVDACLEREPVKRIASAAVLEDRLREMITTPPVKTRNNQWFSTALSCALLAGSGVVWPLVTGPLHAATAPLRQGAQTSTVAEMITSFAADDGSDQVDHGAPAEAPPEKPEPRADRPITTPPAPVDLAPTEEDPPADVPPPETPQPKPAVNDRPAPKRAQAASTARCELMRSAAQDSHRSHNWSAVLRHTRDKSCWSDGSVRQILRVRAFLELGDYPACLKAAGRSRDHAIRKLADECESRRKKP